MLRLPSSLSIRGSAVLASLVAGAAFVAAGAKRYRRARGSCMHARLFSASMGSLAAVAGIAGSVSSRGAESLASALSLLRSPSAPSQRALSAIATLVASACARPVGSSKSSLAAIAGLVSSVRAYCAKASASTALPVRWLWRCVATSAARRTVCWLRAAGCCSACWLRRFSTRGLSIERLTRRSSGPTKAGRATLAVNHASRGLLLRAAQLQR